MSSYRRVLKIVLGFIGFFMLALVMANPLQIFANPVSLIYLEVHKNGVNGVDGLGYASSVTISPDGNHAYAVGITDDALVAFSRDSSTGALTYLEMHKDGVNGVDGLDGAIKVTVSHDNNHVYVSAFIDDSITLFSRNSSTGALTYVETYESPAQGGLIGAMDVIVSPDGNHVYTAASDGTGIDYVAVFSRDSSTGALTYVEKHGEHDNTGAMQNVRQVSISPDGNNVYAAVKNYDSLFVFSRNSSTGSLTYVERHDNDGGADGLNSIEHTTVSPDGNYVYTVGGNSIKVFSRNSSTGALTSVESYNHGDISSLRNIEKLSISPDGNYLYTVSSWSDHKIVVFSRNSSTGALTYLEEHEDGVNGVDGLQDAYSVTVSPDNNYVYVAAHSDHSIAVFKVATLPGAPTGVSATGGNGQATVSWTAPASDGGAAISQYTVTSSPGGQTATTAGTSGTVTGLTNGTSYTFTVKATNSVGTGSASGASSAVVPATVPGAPTGVSATGGNAEATVSWTAPASDGGAAISQYTVTSSPGGQTATTAGTSTTVTGLTNGTSYTFTVTAANSAGTGSASGASSAVVPATVPGAPTGVSGTSGNGQATVSWTAPASDGGAAISQYTVTSSPGGQTATTAGTSGTVTGLTNGTSYTFTVKATNSVGTGSASGASSAVVPATVPGAPTGVSATGGNAEATVSWTAPASDGGAAITQYTVTSSPGGITATTVGTSATVTGLTNGTNYTFTVTAANSLGTGSSSSASDSTSVPPPLIFSVESSSASVGSGTNAVTAGVISGGVGTFTGQVNWGDGTTESAIVTGNSVVGGKHTYASVGTYTATITVTDSAGQQVSDSIVFNVTTDNATVTIPSVGTTGLGMIAVSIVSLFLWTVYRRNRTVN